MATTVTDPMVSPFFKLARELRDQIYDECLVDHPKKWMRRGPSSYARDTAATTFLLVSHQFNSEYSQRAQALSYCRIVDNPWFILEPFTVKLDSDIRIVPQAFAKVRSFRFNLACYDGLHELTAHAIWLPKYLGKLANMQSLVICFSFSRQKFNEPGLLIDAINKEPLLGLENLKQLEVYLVRKGMNIELIANNSSRNHTLIAKLSKDTGKVEAIKD